MPNDAHQQHTRTSTAPANALTPTPRPGANPPQAFSHSPTACFASAEKAMQLRERCVLTQVKKAMEGRESGARGARCWMSSSISFFSFSGKRGSGIWRKWEGIAGCHLSTPHRYWPSSQPIVLVCDHKSTSRVYACSLATHDGARETWCRGRTVAGGNLHLAAGPGPGLRGRACATTAAAAKAPAVNEVLCEVEHHNAPQSPSQ